VERFYRTFYRPSNAVLALSADRDEEAMLDLAEKWFGELHDTPFTATPIPQEPTQTEARQLIVERDVPATTISIAYHMGDRLSKDFSTGDLVSDLLSGGDSSRLYQHLVKEQRLFASVNAYISGDVDPGLFILTGQLLPTTTEEQALAAFRRETEALKREAATAYELEKVKNKFEANTLFGELNVMNKAMNLCYYEFLGDLELVNREIDEYRAIDAERIFDFAERTFRPENSSTLIYRAR
jgi:predicted Zn-dependent peptidase